MLIRDNQVIVVIPQPGRNNSPFSLIEDKLFKNVEYFKLAAT